MSKLPKLQRQKQNLCEVSLTIFFLIIFHYQRTKLMPSRALVFAWTCVLSLHVLGVSIQGQKIYIYSMERQNGGSYVVQRWQQMVGCGCSSGSSNRNQSHHCFPIQNPHTKRGLCCPIKWSIIAQTVISSQLCLHWSAKKKRGRKKSMPECVLLLTWEQIEKSVRSAVSHRPCTKREPYHGNNPEV